MTALRAVTILWALQAVACCQLASTPLDPASLHTFCVKMEFLQPLLGGDLAGTPPVPLDPVLFSGRLNVVRTESLIQELLLGKSPLVSTHTIEWSDLTSGGTIPLTGRGIALGKFPLDALCLNPGGLPSSTGGGPRADEDLLVGYVVVANEALHTSYGTWFDGLSQCRRFAEDQVRGHVTPEDSIRQLLVVLKCWSELEEFESLWASLGVLEAAVATPNQSGFLSNEALTAALEALEATYDHDSRQAAIAAGCIFDLDPANSVEPPPFPPLIPAHLRDLYLQIGSEASQIGQAIQRIEAAIAVR